MKYEVMFYDESDEIIKFGSTDRIVFPSFTDAKIFTANMEIDGCKYIVIYTVDQDGEVIDEYEEEY